jgi:outer membrane receptor protein involved in Fe transport
MNTRAALSAFLVLACSRTALAQQAPQTQNETQPQTQAQPQTRAGGAPASPDVQVPDVNVVAPTPLLGSGIDRSAVPQATEVLTSAQINRTGIPSLTGAILDNIPSATVNDTSGNLFQPDIVFRGFTASPVAGTAQGLAVYVNGARFNDPFGDTVNWDLIVPAAIDTVNVEASNPVFGLNALGGSVNVQLKNGFTFQGADLTAYGGSFDRGAGILEYGHQWRNLAWYFAGDVTHDGGYRQTQASDLYRFYTDLGWRSDAAEIHLGLTAADDTLGNPGATPVQSLNVDPTSIFTAPNTVWNRYVGLNLNGTYAVSDTLSLQGLAYYANLTQRISNGATEEVEPCDDGTGALCNDDGTPVTTRGGGIVPDFLHGGTYSGLVLEGLQAQSYGVSAQATDDAPVFGLKNHFVGGASFDGSGSVFDAQTIIGGFSTNGNGYVAPGYTQDQASEGVEPVRVETITKYVGLFADDVLTVLPHLDLVLGGRFNNAEIDLHDKLGSVLNGQHSYSRFNPTAGLTYTVSPALQAYGSYSETNRAPTPTELSCNSAANPCSLLNFFIGDPNLKQVVARTFEAGLRGRIADFQNGRLSWNADYYHTNDQDDLIFETTAYNPNLAYYTNAGKTLRQGLELNLHYDTPRLHVVAGYALTDATFQSPLLLGSGSNPGSDANGNEHVVPGDRIPGIPEHRGTIVADYKVTDRWTVGAATILESSQYRFGDEANLTKPVGGYMVINLNTSYRVTKNITLFGLVNNVTNRTYDTYGSFGPVGDIPWPHVQGGVTDPRTASPGEPIAGYGGVKVSF